MSRHGTARAGLIVTDVGRAPEMPRASGAGQPFMLGVERTPIANGGWEYHLTVGGARVLWNDSGVGVFAAADVGPVEALPKLLDAIMRQRINETIERMVRECREG